jgi:hypothetical protein
MKIYKIKSKPKSNNALLKDNTIIEQQHNVKLIHIFQNNGLAHDYYVRNFQN